MHFHRMAGPVNMILAERVYNLADGGQVTLTLTEPVQDSDGLWTCRANLQWSGGRALNLPGVGIDKLDTILNAVAVARTTLETSDEWVAGDLTWWLGDDLRLEAKVPQIHLDWLKDLGR